MEIGNDNFHISVEYDLQRVFSHSQCSCMIPDCCDWSHWEPLCGCNFSNNDKYLCSSLEFDKHINETIDLKRLFRIWTYSTFEYMEHTLNLFELYNYIFNKKIIGRILSFEEYGCQIHNINILTDRKQFENNIKIRKYLRVVYNNIRYKVMLKTAYIWSSKKAIELAYKNGLTQYEFPESLRTGKIYYSSKKKITLNDIRKFLKRIEIINNLFSKLFIEDIIKYIIFPYLLNHEAYNRLILKIDNE